MTGKVFVSQSSIDAGRNRAHRRLEAALDREVFQTLAPCKHDRGGYCLKLKAMPKAHCSKDFMECCGETKQNYDRYGEGYNQMGVGC